MAEKFKLPELGENVTSGTIANVLVNEGESVSEGQAVLEIETDKAVVEIPAPASGTVKKLAVKPGQKVAVGELVYEYEAGAAAEKPAEKAPEKKAEPEKPTAKAESGNGGSAPKVAPAKAPERQGERARPQLQVLEKHDTPAGATSGAMGQSASPTVRRLAREMGITLSEVPTSDPNGRVSAEDLRRFVEGGQQGGAERPAAAAKAPAANVPEHAPVPAGSELDTTQDKWGTIALQPMNAVRKATARNMAANWQNIPHVTHHDKADITSLDQLRVRYGKKIEAAGGKFTVTCVLIKALAEALKRFPQFNASIDLENEQLLLKRYYHIGVAVDTPNGLLVPVLRNVDQKSITELCIELPAMAKKARDRKLSLDDMQGGTFTISNLGGIGGNGFTPIINAPEVAILGVSRSAVEPVWQHGAFAPRLLMPLSLSYDHRVIDGADAARFTRWLCEAIEQPWMLFLED